MLILDVYISLMFFLGLVEGHAATMRMSYVFSLTSGAMKRGKLGNPELNGGLNGKIIHKWRIFQQTTCDCRRRSKDPTYFSTIPPSNANVHSCPPLHPRLNLRSPHCPLEKICKLRQKPSQRVSCRSPGSPGSPGCGWARCTLWLYDSLVC